MQIVRDDLWFCVSCMLYAVNGDLPEEGEADCTEGVNAFGPHLVPDWDSETDAGHHEFSRCSCDACDSDLGGERWRFAVLGEVAL